MQNHLIKGACKLLDVAHYALWKLENSTYWAERAAQFVGDNLLIIHKLSFETHLSPALGPNVAVSADVSVFGTRMQFSLDMNLKNLVDDAKKLADTAIQRLKKRLTARLTKPIYDTPSESNDHAISGRILLLLFCACRCSIQRVISRLIVNVSCLSMLVAVVMKILSPIGTLFGRMHLALSLRWYFPTHSLSRWGVV